MTRVLLLGDIHARDRAPSGAFEPYLDDLIDLLRQANALASSHQVEFQVWAGDVFHEKEPRKTAHSTVLRIAQIIQESPVPVWIVPGNHDMSNGRLDSVPDKQPLGVLYAAGALPLDGPHPTAPVVGLPWTEDWEGTSDDHYLQGRIAALPIADPRWAGQHVLGVAHAPFYPPGDMPPFGTVDVPAFADGLLGRADRDQPTSSQVEAESGSERALRLIQRHKPASWSLYYGHIHEDHGVWSQEGITFCNVGALSRGSLHEYNVERSIQVALWEDGQFTPIALSAKSGREVLRVEDHAERKQIERDATDFLESLKGRDLDATSVGSAIESIRAMEDIDIKVRERAIALLEQVA